MPNKSSEWKSQESKKKKPSGVKTNKSEKGDNKKNTDSITNTANKVASKQPQKQPKKEQTGSKSDSKVNEPLQPTEPPKVNKSKTRRAVTLCRRLFAWTMITWLGYYAFFVCGNPHGPKNLPLQSDMCSAIETAKLDFLSLFETPFYKTHVDPVVLPIKNKVEEVYLHHGKPAQAQIASIYRQHGKHHVDQLQKNAQHVLTHQVHPKVKQFHANMINHPYSKETANKIKDTYQHPHVQFVVQKSNQAYHHPTVQRALKSGKKMMEPASIQAGWATCVKTYHRVINAIDARLPPPAIHFKHRIKACIDYAEKTEFTEFIKTVYWASVDFYNTKVDPFLKTNKQVRRARVYYKKNIEGFVNYNVKPAVASINERWHLDQLYHKAVSYLPTR